METRSRRKTRHSEEQTTLESKEESSLFNHIEDLSVSRLHKESEIRPVYTYCNHIVTDILPVYEDFSWSTPTLLPLLKPDSNNIHKSSKKTVKENRKRKSSRKALNFQSTPISADFIPAADFFSRAESKTDLDLHFESDARQRQKESTRRLFVHKQFSDYIPYSSDEELEDWWCEEKTGYTYSKSLSYRSEATPEQRVGSPNMSRKRLRTPSNSYDMGNSECSLTDYSNSHTMSLRSRNVARNYYDDTTDYCLPESSVLSVKNTSMQTIQQRLDYGLDDSDSELEKSVPPPPTKRYNAPLLHRENGNATKLVTKMNGISTKMRYSYDNNDYEASRFHKRQSDITTYTADDDRPLKVFARNMATRFLHFFYSIFSSISTLLTTSYRIIKNPVVAAASFTSWSSRNKAAAWHETSTHVNTTSQTTITYVRNYVSSVMDGFHSYYRNKKQKSPLIWWWIPLLILLLLPMLAFWWKYGELYSEKTVVLYSHMQSFKDQYLPKESKYLTLIQYWIGEFASTIGELASTVGEFVVVCWKLLTEFVYLILAAVTPYLKSWNTTESSITREEMFVTNEMQRIIRAMQETQNSQGSTLSRLENQFNSEMEQIEASKLNRETSSQYSHQHSGKMLELETQQASLLNRLEALSDSVRSLTSSKVNQDSDNSKEKKIISERLATLSGNVQDVNNDMIELKTKYAELERAMKGCCNKTYVTAEDMQSHMTLITSKMMSSFNTSLEEVKNRVWTYFVAKNEVDTLVNNLVQRYMADAAEKNELVLQTLQQSADTILRDSLHKFRTDIENEKVRYQMNITTVGGGLSSSFDVVPWLWNQSKIESVVADMLKKYDADRTGMVDHALESGGGSIMSTRCTEGYQVHSSQLFIMGIGLWNYATNTPRSVIQPNRNPGDCWAFRGSLGYVVIKLTSSVKLTGFTMEHIPKSLSPRGSIDSAPRSFSVYGLHTTNGDGFKLGNYTFKDNGEPLQYFEVQNKNSELFPMVELKIHSNHGNKVYTCVYRFRVHGIRSKEYD